MKNGVKCLVTKTKNFYNMINGKEYNFARIVFYDFNVCSNTGTVA